MKGKDREGGTYRPPGRNFREEGVILKDWGGRLPVALIYPNSYRVGMSNLGIQALYRLFNEEPDIVAERVFRDTTDRGRHVSVESGRPLTDFSVLAFSLSYELDYFSVPAMLSAAGLPVYAAQRDERHPLVIAGGPCITGNPMPVAPFFDALAIGEAEALLPGLMPVLQEGVFLPRQELLEGLAGVPGIYVPAMPQDKVTRQYAEDLNAFDTTTVITSRDTELGDLYLIEAERGCRRGCRFCLVNSIFAPMRYRTANRIIEAAREGLKYRRRTGLVGPAVTDHPQIIEILDGLLETGAETSVSSLRISSLSGEIISRLARGKAKTITIAPEAGSQRLRDVINKGITEDEIMRTVEIIAKFRFQQVKMYCIIGLPTETDDDIEEMVRLAVAIQQTLAPGGTRLTVNAAPFVPKAGTPFQWLPMAPQEMLERRLALLRNTLKRKGIILREESPVWSEVQAALSRGDARLAPVINELAEVSASGWRQAVKRHRIDLHHYVTEIWPIDTALPWDIIDIRVNKATLCRSMEKAMKESERRA